MVQNSDYRLPMPSGSWAVVQKILKAYNAVGDRERATVAQIAELAGLHRPQVSSNNNFLRDLGLLDDGNKLSEVGMRLAMGLELNNQSMVTEGVQESVKYSQGLSQLVDTVRARSTMSFEAFEGKVIHLARLKAKGAGIYYIGTIVDYLIAGNLVREEADKILYVGRDFSLKSEETEKPREDQGGSDSKLPPASVTEGGISIPLGVNRKASLTLPKDWTSRDLPKLIKMIQLALGEDIEGI